MHAINTALCSFGMSGSVFHAPFIHLHPGYNLYAVWERSKNLAAEKYPGIKTYRSLEELLNDNAIELVVVNTPSFTHFDYVKKSLLAGKHVIVEKPFTATTAEADDLIALAKQHNKKISVYQNRRYDSDYKLFKKVLDEKWLGEIVEAEIHYDRYNPGLSAKVHKETAGPAVGSVYDLGSHLIDQALTMFGMPQAVFADIFSMRPDSQVDDYFEILLYYPSLRVRIKSTYYAREPQGFIIHGKKGSFLKSRADVQETALQARQLPGSENWGIEPENQKGLLHTEKDGKVIREYIASLKGNYMEYYDGIFEAIRNNKPLPVTAEEGRNVIRIIEAAYQSNKEKRVVEI
ncbi:MAG TPA: Gfo/Idh/MocA family oxidoreductase [Chitinophagaceae bacterium]|nr:Gfo/Idh/MocA family oxidoreductase [Chitinophagaceae bacterium]